MGPWVFAIGELLLSLAGSLVGRVLLSLGIGAITYTGVDASLAWAKDQFLSGMAGLPAEAVQLAGILKVGVCVSMLLSAVTARLVMAGVQNGTLKKWVGK